MGPEQARHDSPSGTGPEKPGGPPRRNPPPGASNREETGEDEALAAMVVGCRLGDRDAQRRLYESFHRRVYRLMVRMVGADQAPDLTQQVFLQVFRKIDAYSGRGRFDRWLYRVAANEALQHLRRKRSRQQHALVYEPADESLRGDERVERKDLMEQALARLDPELRSICLLREIEGLSYREIAETLDIPGGTVGSRLNRARRVLKQHLIDLGWEP